MKYENQKTIYPVEDETHRMFQILLSNIPGMAYRCLNEPDWTMEFVSDGCLELTGYKSEELTFNKIISYGKLIYKDDTDYVWKEVQEALVKNKPWEIEYRIITKDKQEKWVWERGRIVAIDENGKEILEGFITDITERKRSEDKIMALLVEKEVLLKEVHHRIKNNMVTIDSLLALQAETLNEPAAVVAIQDARSRVQSMLVLYDKLFHSKSFSDVSVNEYLPDLIDQVINNFPNSNIVKVEKVIDRFSIDSKKILTLGIIVNELLTNIMKYAFKGRDSGKIFVSALLKENHVSIIIQDNGIGIPEFINFDNSTSFGLMLIKVMTEQIGGIIKIERINGTKILFEFEK